MTSGGSGGKKRDRVFVIGVFRIRGTDQYFLCGRENGQQFQHLPDSHSRVFDSTLLPHDVEKRRNRMLGDVTAAGADGHDAPERLRGLLDELAAVKNDIQQDVQINEHLHEYFSAR